MDRKPGSPSPFGGNGSKAKPLPVESFAPEQPVQIRADASAFELFSREASPEELRALTRILNEWAQGDEKGFPCQLSLIARNQFRAAAAVPIEMARVLQLHHDTLEDSATRFVRATDTKLNEFEKVGKLVSRMEAQVERVTGAGDEALKRIYEITANLLQAEERAKQAARSNDFIILAMAFLVVTVLAFLLGGVTCRYMFLRGWMH